MPQTNYDLKLKADLNSQNGLFLPQANNPGRSRGWAQTSTGNAGWQDTGINPDVRGNGPSLSFNTTAVAQSDTFQVTVYFINADPSSFASITISAVFTPMDHNTLPVVSPFRDGNGNVQSLVSATWQPNSNSPNIYLHSDTGPGEHAIVFTPGAFNINPAVVPSNRNGRNWRFEFTVVAQFTTAAGVTTQFAYDPEMEVDIATSGDEPVPVAGAVGA